MRRYCLLLFFVVFGLNPVGAQCLSVLVVLPEFPHTYRTFFDNQIKGLIEGGHELTILSIKPSTDPFSQDLIPLDIESKTFYHELPKDRRDFDIIYVPSPCLSHLSFQFIKDSHVKGLVVAGFHSEIHPRHKNPIVNYYLPCSDYSGKDLVGIGIDEKKVIVHHCGVKLDRFQFRKQKRQSPDEPTKILTVCRLVKYKGVEDSLKAVARVVEAHPVEFTIVGDGTEFNHLVELSKSLGIEKCVGFLGYQNPAEVAKVLDETDLFIHPSFTLRGHTEGIPTSMMEAMAIGMPIISTIHSGIPELVEDGKTGFLVKERDVDTLAEKLSYLIEHPRTWPKMARAGRRVIEKEFNENKQNQRLCELFNRLHAENHPEETLLPVEKPHPKAELTKRMLHKPSKFAKKHKSSKYLKRKMKK